MREISAMLEARAPEIEALVNAQWRPLARYAYRLLRDSGLAEDVVQESFCRYMNTSFSYGDEQQRISWLFRVVHNLSIDFLKRESRRPELNRKAQFPSRVPPPSQAIIATETWRELEHLLDALTLKQRTIAILFFQENKTYKEIAEITGESMSNVGMLLHRGLKKLRTIIDPEEFS